MLCGIKYAGAQSFFLTKTVYWMKNFNCDFKPWPKLVGKKKKKNETQSFGDDFKIREFYELYYKT